MLSSSRVKYVAGVSSSCRSGYVIKLIFEPGVTGPLELGDPDRPIGESEFCLNRWGMLKISPKLFRPLVDVDVRPEMRCGDGCPLSCALANESKVDDLVRDVGIARLLFDGVERAE